MLGKILLLASAFSTVAMANLSPREMRERLEIRGDVYLMDDSGKHVISGPVRTNVWRFDAVKGDYQGGWSGNSDDGFLGMRQSWQIDADGALKVKLGEYSSADKEHNLLGLLEEKEFTVTDFAPITWKLKNIKGKNYVARFVPVLRELRDPVQVDSLPVAGAGVVISDNAGYLWADGADFNGKFVALRSHRGTLALSYVPFKGARELGQVENREMVIKASAKLTITLRSETSFLPAGVNAKVYGIYLPGKKSNGVNSLHTWSSNKEEKILAALEE